MTTLQTPPREVVSEILRDMLHPEEFKETLSLPSSFLVNMYPQEFDYDYQIRVAMAKLKSLAHDHMESELLGDQAGSSKLQRWIQDAGSRKDSYSAMGRSFEHLRNLKNEPKFKLGQLHESIWLGRKISGISDEEKSTCEFAGGRISAYYFLAPYVMFQENRMSPFIISQSNWNILGVHYRKLSQLYPGYISRLTLED